MGQRAVIGFANAWAPVHAYYTAFGLLQAWFAANGMSGTGGRSRLASPAIAFGYASAVMVVALALVVGTAGRARSLVVPGESQDEGE